MAHRTIPLGRTFGIPINLDYSWFLIFALLTWVLGTGYYPMEFKGWPRLLYWIMGAVTAIMLFVSVLLHELGHSLVARYFKIPVRNITLFIFGGAAQIGAEPPAQAEFLVAIAGLFVSLILAGIFYVLQPLVASVQPLLGLFKYLTYINLALLVFNFIPGYPLDGGRVFRAFVWAVTKNMPRATIIAANFGRFFGFLLIFLGVWQIFTGRFGGLWTAFIGWFLESAASEQGRQILFQDLLGGHTVGQAMSRRCFSVDANLTLQQLVDDYIFGTGGRCYLVNENGRAIGLMTVHHLKEIARADWPNIRLSQAMLPLDRSKRLSADGALSSALQEMDRDGVNQLPVMAGDQVIGMLSREDVITYLQTLQELET